MTLFRRRGKGEVDPPTDHTASSVGTSTREGLNDDAQDIIRDNLDVMYDIIMDIREDPDFAKSIYADCPRLQHMLEKRPDLRPIFEDPKLVRINFEQVYREAGGVLPEDKVEEEEEKKPQSNWLAIIVNSPCFKVLKLLLFVKKVYTIIFGGGIALLVSFWKGLCCFDDPDVDVDNDAANDVVNQKNLANKEALNRAADHMEKPEVQAQMQELLENDPEGLQEAIDNDPELSELRDSNPLCAELMSDPDSMRILTDPDNLRALGEAPDLIEADFADPDWTPPDDIETGGNGITGIDVTQGTSGGGLADVVPTDGDFDFELEDDTPQTPDQGDGLNFELGDNDVVNGDNQQGLDDGVNFELGDNDGVPDNNQQSLEEGMEMGDIDLDNDAVDGDNQQNLDDGMDFELGDNDNDAADAANQQSLEEGLDYELGDNDAADAANQQGPEEGIDYELGDNDAADAANQQSLEEGLDYELGDNDAADAANQQSLDEGVDYELGDDNNQDADNGNNQTSAGDNIEFELGDNNDNNNNNAASGNANANANRSRGQQDQSRDGEENGGGGGGFGGFFTQIGTGITDMVANEIFGMGFSELTGQDDGLDALDQADQAADTANNAVDEAVQKVDEDVVEHLEEGLDEMEEEHDERQESNDNRAAMVAAGAGAVAMAGVGAGMAMHYAGRPSGDAKEDGELESKSRSTVEVDPEAQVPTEIKPRKPSRFRAVANLAVTISSAGKGFLATTLLGEDLGEFLVDKFEDKDKDKNDRRDEENQSKQDQTESDNQGSFSSALSSKSR